jgi:hypothetical protein
MCPAAALRPSRRISCLRLLPLLAAFGMHCAAAEPAALQACADFVFRAGMEASAVAAPCRVAGDTAVFADRDAFLAALAQGRVENAFDDVVAGASGGLRYTQGRIEYVIYTQFFADGPLYNGDGFVSTERVGDSIVVTQLGTPVTAIGGEFHATDFFLAPIDGDITLELDDGTFETIKSAGAGAFRGFISIAPIGRLTISAAAAAESLDGASSPDRWPALDNLVIGDGR